MTLPSTGIFSPGFTNNMIIHLHLRYRYFDGLAIGCTSKTVFGWRPISFLMAEEVLDLAFSSRSLPSDIKAITTAAASKYTCG